MLFFYLKWCSPCTSCPLASCSLSCTHAWCRCRGRAAVSELTLRHPSASAQHTSPSYSLPVVSIATTDFSPPPPPRPSGSPVCSVFAAMYGKREWDGEPRNNNKPAYDIGLAAKARLRRVRSVPPAVSEPQTRWPANWSALCAVPVGLPDNSQWTQCPPPFISVSLQRSCCHLQAAIRRACLHQGFSTFSKLRPPSDCFPRSTLPNKWEWHEHQKNLCCKYA